MKKPFIIGIVGASGSGKSYLSEKLSELLGKDQTFILYQDHYYKDQSDLTMDERTLTNYDHPNALDFDLLVKQIKHLKKGKAIKHPQYDYSLHTRKPEKQYAEPRPFIILDGILLYTNPELVSLLDYKIFTETPLDICFVRRLERDIKLRGRTAQSVIDQYIETVRPMYFQFVRPSKKLADIVIEFERPFKEQLTSLYNTIKNRTD